MTKRAVQGAPGVPARAYKHRYLCQEMARVGPQPQPAKCAAYGEDQAAGQTEADVAGVPFNPGGIVFAGSPVGMPEQAVAHARDRCERVLTSTEKLCELPLSVQDTFLLLRMSIAHRLAYLQRVVPPGEELEGELNRARWRLIAAAAAKAGLQDDVNDDPRVMAALRAPLRHGGCGLDVGYKGSARAAYLTSAALAQCAALAGPAQFRPFAGPL
jgi:hypothetical protein